MTPTRLRTFFAAGAAISVVLTACSGSPQSPSPATVASLLQDSPAISVLPGDAVTSVEVLPEKDEVIEGTGPDGTVYRLELPALAIREPVTISLRPLKQAEIPGATMVAGVEIEPSGLELFIPATLTMIPPGGVEGMVSLEYTGSAEANATLAALAPSSPPNGHSILLTHFSGGVVVSLDAEGDSLFLGEGNTFNLNTVEGTQARAEYAIREAQWSLKNGHPSPEMVQTVIDNFTQIWKEAEARRILNDPNLNEAIASGDINQAGVITSEAARALLLAKEAGTGTAVLLKIMQKAADFANNVLDHLQQDPTFQRKLDSGLVSNLEDLLAKVRTLTSLARQLALLGDNETHDRIFRETLEFVRRATSAIVATCSQAPILPELAGGFARHAALLGDEQLSREILDACKPLACTGTGLGQPAAEAGVILAAAVVAQDACRPLPQSWVGSASSTHRIAGEGGNDTIVTQAATQVVFDLLPASSGDGGSYVIASGSLSWTMSATGGECTIHGEGTEALRPGDGSLLIAGAPLTYIASGPSSDFTRTATWTCAGESSLELPALSYPWLSTGIRPYDPAQLRLEGTYASEFGAGSGTTGEWTWSFVPSD